MNLAIYALMYGVIFFALTQILKKDKLEEDHIVHYIKHDEHMIIIPKGMKVRKGDNIHCETNDETPGLFKNGFDLTVEEVYSTSLFIEPDILTRSLFYIGGKNKEVISYEHAN